MSPPGNPGRASPGKLVQTRSRQLFNVGDLVRISHIKNTFERGHEKNFSEEIFKITRVSYRQGLHTYILQDLNDEIIDGFFYKRNSYASAKNV